MDTNSLNSDFTLYNQIEEAYGKVVYTQEYLSMRNVYENKMKAIKKQKLQIVWLIAGVFGSLFVMFGFVLMILALTGSL